MARAIDADKFERFLMSLPDEVLCEDCCYVVVNEMIKQPTIEAEPVKHGNWVDKTVWIGGIGHCRYECSRCGYVVNHKPNSRGDGKGGKYCDECGTKMGCE